MLGKDALQCVAVNAHLIAGYVRNVDNELVVVDGVKEAGGGGLGNFLHPVVCRRLKT